jgi:hypothetical protein
MQFLAGCLPGRICPITVRSPAAHDVTHYRWIIVPGSLLPVRLAGRYPRPRRVGVLSAFIIPGVLNNQGYNYGLQRTIPGSVSAPLEGDYMLSLCFELLSRRPQTNFLKAFPRKFKFYTLRSNVKPR